MWMVVNCKNGVSSYEIHRATGVTQKTAWFMDHRIRLALGMGATNKFSGRVSGIVGKRVMYKELTGKTEAIEGDL